VNLRQLAHLTALAEEGSFSRAAERLHLTQSALSRSVQTLEDELGARLIDRAGKRSTLTPCIFQSRTGTGSPIPLRAETRARPGALGACTGPSSLAARTVVGTSKFA
jgi:hypothetical protein